MSVFKNFQFKLSISDFQNSEHFIFRTSAKFNFRKFDRVGLRKNIADNVLQLGEVADLEALSFNLEQMLIRNPNVQFSAEPAILPNCCWTKPSVALTGLLVPYEYN